MEVVKKWLVPADGMAYEIGAGPFCGITPGSLPDVADVYTVEPEEGNGRKSYVQLVEVGEPFFEGSKVEGTVLVGDGRYMHLVRFWAVRQIPATVKVDALLEFQAAISKGIVHDKATKEFSPGVVEAYERGVRG